MNKDKLTSLLKDRHFRRSMIIAISGIVMHYTPDYIDEVIKTLLVLWGITDLQTAVKLAGKSDG